MKQTKTLGSGFPLNTLIQDLRGAQFLLANEAANEIESLRQKLAASQARELLRERCAVEANKAWFEEPCYISTITDAIRALPVITVEDIK